MSYNSVTAIVTGASRALARRSTRLAADAFSVVISYAGDDALVGQIKQAWGKAIGANAAHQPFQGCLMDGFQRRRLFGNAAERSAKPRLTSRNATSPTLPGGSGLRRRRSRGRVSACPVVRAGP